MLGLADSLLLRASPQNNTAFICKLLKINIYLEDYKSTKHEKTITINPCCGYWAN